MHASIGITTSITIAISIIMAPTNAADANVDMTMHYTHNSHKAREAQVSSSSVFSRKLAGRSMWKSSLRMSGSRCGWCGCSELAANAQVQ
jgi:hypothetical protein